MPRVELIYDAQCPNIPAARAQLLRAFAATGLTAHWQEWERNAPESPDYVGDFGSPTVLVNGADVEPGPAPGAACCRLYASDEGRFQGVPAWAALTAALSQADATSESEKTPTWRAAWPALPAVGLALLPKLTCPACWPAYAGLLSALGLGFINFTPYLLPLTAVFLLVSLALLVYRAPRRRGYAPLGLGILAATLILFGKFGLNSNAALYSGIALLMGAALWNAWPKPVSKVCPACNPAGRAASCAGVDPPKEIES